MLTPEKRAELRDRAESAKPFVGHKAHDWSKL